MEGSPKVEDSAKKDAASLKESLSSSANQDGRIWLTWLQGSSPTAVQSSPMEQRRAFLKKKG